MTTYRPGYKESLDWVLNNDDVEFLEDEDPTENFSTTVALIADQFRKTPERVVLDLIHRQETR